MRAQPLAEAEFVAVDVETTGRLGDACEITEVGAVLVGGGETHGTYESLVTVEQPVTRVVERLTGITAPMLADAPPPAEALAPVAELMRGRVLVAHNAGFDRRALRQAFERCGLEWPEPPVLCTLSLGRQFAPLATRRSLGALAASLGVEIDVLHRALPDALACARVFCALFPKLCAHAATVSEAVALVAPRRRGRRRSKQASAQAVPRESRPDLSTLPNDPGVYVFRDAEGRPLYVGKSIAIRTRARAHFCAPSGWTERAEVVDYKATNSELGALVLENRLIKEWRPPGNKALKRTDRFVYLVCRLDIPFPVLEVRPEPASGHAVNVGPLRGRRAVEELAGQLSSLYRLRQCGRKLKLREFRSVYGQMDRCLSPCLGDLDPNLYRRQLDSALALFDEDDAAGERLLEELDRRMAEASCALRYEQATALRERRARVAAVLERLEGQLQAIHARPRVVLARHPARKAWDVLWIVGGRVADWGPLVPAAELVARSEVLRPAAERRSGPPVLQPEEVDEVRIVAGALAAEEPRELSLERATSRRTVARWLKAAGAPA